MLSDDNLIRRAREGDIDAFEQIVRRYDQRILALALNFTQDADDAKDVYQEIFMRVYRALPRFQFRSQFSTWLHRIAVNACYTYRRKAQRHEMFSIDAPGESGDQLPQASWRELADGGRTGEDLVLDQEISGQIRAALNQLSPKQRLVFILRHYHDFKLREIAAMLRCAEGTVKRHLFAATQRMRRQMQIELNEGT